MPRLHGGALLNAPGIFSIPNSFRPYFLSTTLPNFSDANEGWGTSQPLYKGWRSGRPAAGRPGPAAPLPGGRDLVAPLRGGMGFSAKIFAENLR